MSFAANSADFTEHLRLNDSPFKLNLIQAYLTNVDRVVLEVIQTAQDSSLE